MNNIAKRLFILAVAFSGSIHAACCGDTEDYSFYFKIGTGVSFSESAQVHAPSRTWSPAVQGYNSTLGNRAIGLVGFGCEWMHCVDVEVNLSNRSTFKYRKFQTPVGGGVSYKREFDLDVTPVLFSVNLLGSEFSCLSREIACGKIYPLIGFGVGVSHLSITNFRTTGLPPTGDSAPYPSFSAENEYTRRNNFTYTAQVGFEYMYKNMWAISTGYRWFDAGKFKGPRYQRVSSGSAVDIGGEEWKMRFRANEWFIEFKYLL